MLSEVMFLTPNPDPIASVKPLLLLLTEYPNSYKGKNRNQTIIKKSNKIER